MLFKNNRQYLGGARRGILVAFFRAAEGWEWGDGGEKGGVFQPKIARRTR